MQTGFFENTVRTADPVRNGLLRFPMNFSKMFVSSDFLRADLTNCNSRSSQLSYETILRENQVQETTRRSNLRKRVVERFGPF